MQREKILVTGADGQLGKELRRMADLYPDKEFVFLTRKELSIDDESAVVAIFEKFSPSICINCAAYTAVDKAESERELAFLINGIAVGWLARAARSCNAKFIHISTDYVFDGNSSAPLKENDRTDPVNTYGASKLQGEELAMKENPASLIIRTAWVYSAYGHNFVKTMIRLMSEKESIGVINDQIGSPTYAADLAAAILIICSAENYVPGIFHYSNAGRISWFDFAMVIKTMTGSPCKVNPISTAQYPTAARRPHFSLLDTGKIKSVYALLIPGWKESLDLCLKRLQSEV